VVRLEQVGGPKSPTIWRQLFNAGGISETGVLRDAGLIPDAPAGGAAATRLPLQLSPRSTQWSRLAAGLTFWTLSVFGSARSSGMESGTETTFAATKTPGRAPAPDPMMESALRTVESTSGEVQRTSQFFDQARQQGGEQTGLARQQFEAASARFTQSLSVYYSLDAIRAVDRSLSSSVAIPPMTSLAQPDDKTHGSVNDLTQLFQQTQQQYQLTMEHLQIAKQDVQQGRGNFQQVFVAEQSLHTAKQMLDQAMSDWTQQNRPDMATSAMVPSTLTTASTSPTIMNPVPFYGMGLNVGETTRAPPMTTAVTSSSVSSPLSSSTIQPPDLLSSTTSTLSHPDFSQGLGRSQGPEQRLPADSLGITTGVLHGPKEIPPPLDVPVPPLAPPTGNNVPSSSVRLDATQSLGQDLKTMRAHPGSELAPQVVARTQQFEQQLTQRTPDVLGRMIATNLGVDLDRGVQLASQWHFDHLDAVSMQRDLSQLGFTDVLFPDLAAAEDD